MSHGTLNPELSCGPHRRHAVEDVRVLASTRQQEPFIPGSELIIAIYSIEPRYDNYSTVKVGRNMG
jgi:propanediol dehydratase large subunit